MALPESPFEKRSKFQVIDGGLSQAPQSYVKPVVSSAITPTNIYDGSLKLLAKDLETFLSKQS